jgi:hypothetical protein
MNDMKKRKKRKKRKKKREGWMGEGESGWWAHTK